QQILVDMVCAPVRRSGPPRSGWAVLMCLWWAGWPPGRPAQGGAPRAVTRSGEHQVGDQEADEDAGGHPQYGGQTGRPLSGPVALIGVGGIQERRDDGGDAAHGQSSWPVDVHDRYHSPLMWWVRASQGWDTPVPPRPPAHERPEQGGGTPERPRLG